MRTFSCLAVTAVFLLVPCYVSLAQVDVYRCVLEGGHVSYQQIPCSNESEPMKLEHRRSGWSSLRPGEQALLNRYRKADAVGRRSSRGQQKQPARESKSCWSKRKQLEAVRSKLHRGYKLKEGDELRRKRDNYADYLRQFCS